MFSSYTYLKRENIKSVISVNLSHGGNMEQANLGVIASVNENSKMVKKPAHNIGSLNRDMVWTTDGKGLAVARYNLSQAPNLPELKKLTIWNSSKSKRSHSGVKQCALQRRNGKKSNAAGIFPSGLGCLTDLEVLEFAGEKGMEIDVRQIGLLTGLTSLDLKGCVGIDYNAMEVLANLKGLKVLGMAGTDAGDKCLEFIPSLVNLHALDVSKCFFGTLGMKSVGTLSALRKLVFRHTHITYQGLEALAGLLELQDLDLHGCSSVGDEEMKIVGRFYHLQRLMLGHTLVGDDGIKHLACLVDLGQLELCGCKRLSDAGLIALGWFKNLGQLDLSFTAIGNDGLEYLSGLEKLRSLDLFMCQNVSDAGMQLFHSLTKIEELVLSRTMVGNQGLMHLAGVERLVSLELIGCERVGDEGLNALSGLGCLKRLQIYNTAISFNSRWLMDTYVDNDPAPTKEIYQDAKLLFGTRQSGHFKRANIHFNVESALKALCELVENR